MMALVGNVADGGGVFGLVRDDPEPDWELEKMVKERLGK